LVEHFHGKEGVAGSSPAEGFLQVQVDRAVCASMAVASAGARPRRVHQSDGETFLGELAACRADRFFSRDRVLRRLVEEPRVVAQTRFGGVTELLGDVDDVLGPLG
jgi:hypothetical protein